MKVLNMELIKRLMKLCDDMRKNDDEKEFDEAYDINKLFSDIINGCVEEDENTKRFRSFFEGVSFEEIKSILVLRDIGKNRVVKSQLSPYEIYEKFRRDVTVNTRDEAISSFSSRYRFFTEDINRALSVLDVLEDGVLGEEEREENRGGVFCKYCGKNLLENRRGAIIDFVTNSDNRIIRVVPCCKGSCDKRFLDEVKEDEGEYFKELDLLTNPIFFIMECLSMMSKIHNGRGFENEGLLEEYQEILTCCSKYITREMTEDEKNIAHSFGLL